jgi:Caspase domain
VTRRLAILVANDLYENGALSPLLAPKADAEQLFNLLSDPEVGAFEPAEILTNRSKPEIERSVEKMFRNARPGDLLLLYYSGHGIRDAMGRLHLAVWNTEPDLLHSTAVSASLLKELLEETQVTGRRRPGTRAQGRQRRLRADRLDRRRAGVRRHGPRCDRAGRAVGVHRRDRARHRDRRGRQQRLRQDHGGRPVGVRP